jgi:hypothetical protein
MRHYLNAAALVRSIKHGAWRRDVIRQYRWLRRHARPRQPASFEGAATVICI